MNWGARIKVILLLVVFDFCFFEFSLHRSSETFLEFEAILRSFQWMVLVCLVVWCGAFQLLAFNLNDLPLIGLLLISIVSYFLCSDPSWQMSDAIALLFGATLGKGACVFLKSGKQIAEDDGVSEIKSQKSEISFFLAGLILLLAFSAWWHLDMNANYYHGPRWMGIWNNPNIYGMLMGAGVVLAIGLLARSQNCADSRTLFSFSFLRKSIKSAEENVSGATPDTARGTRALPIILVIAAGMMAVGLFFSYSRGAWLGGTVGLLYLAKTYGKLKWRWVLPGSVVVAMVIVAFWHSTADTDQWYLKRLDLSRPSSQHRVSAWRGALQMMRDHPFGVGWNKAVGVYDKDYSHPEGGAAALTMNSYLMLGTELGLPGLLCFVVYLGLCLRGKCRIENEEGRIQTACRAGTFVFAVAFWFDGGLFDLPTAAMFWVLLELGTPDLSRQKQQATAITLPVAGNQASNQKRHPSEF